MSLERFIRKSETLTSHVRKKGTTPRKVFGVCLHFDLCLNFYVSKTNKTHFNLSITFLPYERD